MTNINDYVGGNSIKAEDLADQDVTLTIAGFEVKSFEGERPKIILAFNGTDKTLVANATNLKRIAQLLGSEEVERWVGQQVTLGWEWVTFQGDTVKGVRVMLPGMSSPRAAAATGAPAGNANPPPSETGSFSGPASDEVPF